MGFVLFGRLALKGGLCELVNPCLLKQFVLGVIMSKGIVNSSCNLTLNMLLVSLDLG